MSASKKGRSGKKNLGRTKNQLRKEAYAKMRELHSGGKVGKRSGLHLRKKLIRAISHKLGPCGNSGCKRCSPLFKVGGALYKKD